MALEFVFPDTVTVSEQEIGISSFSEMWKDSLLTLAKQITEKYGESGKKRFVIAIGGPSGSSKSTSAKLLETVINTTTNYHALHISLDGYHFSQDYLENNRDSNGEVLAAHKGRYDSFDHGALLNDLTAFREGEVMSFPRYSRKIHEPIKNAVPCERENVILIVEGLWLLYNKAPWNELLPFYDYTIYFQAPAESRRENTIKRHIRGGRTPEESETFYERSDRENDTLISENIAPHDFDFKVNSSAK